MYENICSYKNELKDNKKIYLFFKRMFDIVVSVIALLLAFPIFLVIALAIKLEDHGPVFYKHKRVGKNGKTIYLYKFRSMVVDAEAKMKEFTKEQQEEFQKFYKLTDDPRITKIGKNLRKTSLDELPQLLNILKGDMSIIGPRPVVEKELNKFGNGQELLLSVKPGLTGLWACSGRSDTTYEERVKKELYYAENYSMKLDLLCFFKTCLSVVKGTGAR